MPQPTAIVAFSDTWPLGSPLQAARRSGQTIEPVEDALATQEVPSTQIATALLPAIRLPQSHTPPRRIVPQPACESDDLPTVLLPAASVSCSATPTARRPEPMRYCYQCGAVIPPWREQCFRHERQHGR